MSNSSKTDWDALAAMKDEEINYSEVAPLAASFFERASVWRPQPQVPINLHIDADIVEWFQQSDSNWEARMLAALRFYVESHKNYHAP